MTKYPSRYSNDKKVTAAQYLAELMCERQAQKNKKELPKQFWNLPHWSKKFKSQLFAAYGLLKLYDEAAIIKAVKSKEARNIYSLRAPTLDDIIKEHQHRLQLDKSKPKDISIVRKDVNAKPRQYRVEDNILGRLSELDT
tara:strand:+ start:4314 stop:4733 length:420 start_codon:yes stop_codon:yes gene_type:complete